MEIAIGLMGLSLGVLGAILAYIWRTNGRYMRELTKMFQLAQHEQAQNTRELAKMVQSVQQGKSK